MKANEINEIKSGDIGLVRRYVTWNPISWISAAVRFFTGSNWNHAVSFVKMPYGLFVIEAVVSGVRMCRVEKWVKKYEHDIKVIRFIDIEKPKNIQWNLMRHIGKPYDFTALIKHQIVFQVARWFGFDKWIGRTDKTGADEKIYCSELIAIAYNLPEWWTYTAEDLQMINHSVIHDSRY